MAEVFANSEDPDQTPQNATSDLGLYCLLNTLLRVSRLHWVKKDLILSDRLEINVSHWCVNVI